MDYDQRAGPNFFRPSANSERCSSLGEQPSFLNVRVSTKLPERPIGKDLAFICFGDDGRVYYCKGDRNARFVRATEWIATKLAEHLGISVPACSIVEDKDGQTYFGSRQPTSLAGEHELHRLLSTAATDEIGRPSRWLGAYLARILAFDLFINNPDRTTQNFVLDREGNTGRLNAIDFACSGLLNFKDGKFPVASDNTSLVGALLRRRHGAHVDAANEMLDWIGAVRPSVIEGIVRSMPDEWLSRELANDFYRDWSDGSRNARVARAKALIKDAW